MDSDSFPLPYFNTDVPDLQSNGERGGEDLDCGQESSKVAH